MTTGLEIAVIGMACRFPGARNTDEFWANLRDGKETITHFTDEELEQAGVSPAELRDPSYVKARGVLDDPALFDAGFFQVNPREAELMDPQHRFFLECGWEALESSGYAADRSPGAVGVYAGAYENGYRQNLYGAPDVTESAGWLLTHLSSERDYLATRVAYKLDLTGPALTLQTACSTSLVAVHLASQSLLSGSCDLALAGGSTVRARQTEGYRFEPEGILSPDGHCRAFDAAAQGTVSSSGVAVVVLKRLEDALRDRDTIHAVIKGSAVNNDGAAKVGFSAPSVIGQTRVIREALAMAEVDPGTITYVETHGSGTALGDPIEVEALTRAFRSGTDRVGFCAIGSVKTNIGHTHAASGTAGLIKTILALKHRQIPSSLHYEHPNPDIDFDSSPFHVNAALADWKSDGAPRRAGVSSFGTGGTNAHVVLEEAPDLSPAPSSRPWQLLTLSGRTETAAEQAVDLLAGHLREHPGHDLADVAHTLQAGRKAFGHRRVLVCRDTEDAAEALATRAPRRLLRESPGPARHRPVAFMFSGLGDQYVDMARDLYDTTPVFREEVDRCAELFRRHLGVDLRTVLYPERPAASAAPGTAGGMDLRSLLGRREPQDRDPAAAELNRTVHGQPVMFMVEWALGRMWSAWGIRPQAMIGYSLGEWVAACTAGVLTLEDAVFLVAQRARLIESLPGGAMLAVPLPEHEAAGVDERLSVAAVNGPSLSVLAGETEAVEEVQARLTDEGVACRRLQTTHAFHTGMLEPARARFIDFVRAVPLRPPGIPYLSNVTGTWITPEEAVDPEHWARHMCETVRFSDGVRELWRDPDRIILEVGPGQAYGSLALQLLPEGGVGGRTVLSSLPSATDRQPAAAFALTSLGRLWLAGAEPDWDGVHAGEPRGRVPLPTHAFERERYWVDGGRRPQPGHGAARAPRPSMEKRADQADWYSVPAWTSTAPLLMPDAQELAEGPRRWLLFADGLGVAEKLAARLGQAGARVSVVVPGERFEQPEPDRFVLAPGRREDYEELLRRLDERDARPDTIVHLWTVTADGADPAAKTRPGTGAADTNGTRPNPGGGSATTGTSDPDQDQEQEQEQDPETRFRTAQEYGFYSLLFLTQAWGALGDDTPLHLAAVSTGLRQVTDADPVSPEKATILGPCTVAPQEYPGLTTQSIDIGPAPRGLSDATTDAMVNRLVAELLRRPDPVVAHRGRSRWIPRWESVRVDAATGLPGAVRHRGVYLITGGLGGMGLTLAEHLARTAQARIVLVGRSALPPRDEWEAWLKAHGEPDETSRRIRSVTALEELGAQVLVVGADVTDRERMRAAVDEVRRRFGTLDGVVHAAGLAGGGVMQLKDRQTADRVLAPKTLGTLVLREVTRDVPLDFMVLCSSTIAFSGGAGQVDYCAANAFLDAFAGSRPSDNGPLTVSVNWDAWQEVGMAANTILQGSPGSDAPPRSVDHPLLSTCLVDTPEHAVYAKTFAVAADWVVDEHRMLGHAVVPGTAYLEMVRAAVADQGLGNPVRFEDVLFVSPVVLGEDQAREVRVVLDKAAGEFRFSAVSRAASGDPRTAPWVEHVTGRVLPSPHDPGEAPDVGIRTLTERHGLRETGPLTHTGPMTFGPRSQCVERAWVGEGQAVALLTMPERYAGDLDGLGLHPFLLDVATGFGSLYLLRDYLMPLRYRSIRVRGSLPARIYSFLRYRDDAVGGTGETVLFDAVIYDEEGHELVRVEEFVMKKARALEAKLPALRDGTSDEVTPYAYPATGPGQHTDNAFKAHLDSGILPAEGAAAFERVLRRRFSPRVVVATKDLDAIVESVGAVRQDQDPGGTGRAVARDLHPRPNLANDYVPPRDDVERTLAGLWREQIGVDQVGVHDNFYELGGHSLLGIRLLTRLRDTWDVPLTLQSLFENLTVAELAQAISARLRAE